MADLYDPRYTRSKLGKFNKNKNFVSLVSGTDAFFLEDEFNEHQWIQNENTAENLRTQYHSGIFKKSNNDIVQYQQTVFKPNLLLFKSITAIINGYLLDISGSLGFLNDDLVIKDRNINNIILYDPPQSGERYDFVYLAMWFKEIKSTDDIWFNGNKNNYNGIIENDLLDKRVNGETCRRIQLQWSIKTAENIDFNTNKFGFDNKFKDGVISASADKPTPDKYSFWRSDLNLDNNFNFDDKGLWVAGSGVSGEMGTTDGYIYAIPLFKVRRRNSGGYTQNNLNGAINFNKDLENNLSDRPDGKFANIIYNDDISDLRNIVKVNDLKSILECNFNNLLTGQLYSNSKPKIIKEYFGIDPIIPNEDTFEYISCNEQINNDNIIGNPDYEFTPSVEREGILIKSNGYFSYEINQPFSVGRVSMIIKLQDSNNKDLWSLRDESGEILSYVIKDGNLILSDSIDKLFSIPIKSTNASINSFSHLSIVWSKEENKLYVIINGSVIEVVDISERLPNNIVKSFNLGYSDYGFYCKNVILDEIEYSKQFSVSYPTLPIAFIDDGAKLNIDIQRGRRSYTNLNSKSIMVKRINVKSSSDGRVEFSLESPVGSLFTSDIPKVYFDNEGKLANTIWSGLGTNTVNCKIDNLGNQIDYNLIIVYEVQFGNNQGLSYLPKKVYRLVSERISDSFFPVNASNKVAKYDIDMLVASDTGLSDKKDSLLVYNSNLYKELGFGCGIKLHINGNNNDIVNIPITVYNQIITTIYDASVVGSLTKKQLIKSFEIVNNEIILKLNCNVTDSETLEIIVGTQLPSVIYNYLAGGIDNLFNVQKVIFNGDGSTKEFIYSCDTRVVSSMVSIIDNEKKFIAYVNNEIEEINVEFKDTFVIFKFDKAPVNKSEIKIFINVEYEPLMSERLEVWYEAVEYQGSNNKDYIESLNDKNIIQNFDSIFVLTEGIVDSSNKELNKEEFSSVYLPCVDAIDYNLNGTKLIDETTSLKLNINYALPNIKDYNNYLPFVDQLKIELSDQIANRGFTGYVSLNNKSLYSMYKLSKATPHLNVIPLLVKDDDDLLKMVIITTYLENKDVVIDSNYNYSAIDVFNLKENVLLK